MFVYSLIITNIILLVFPALLWFLLKIAFSLFKVKVRYKFFGISSLLFCLLWTLLYLYGYGLGRFRYQVNELSFADERVPEDFDGYRIVHISDLHIGGFHEHEAFVDTLVEVINKQHPDLICFTGDLVSISHEELLPYIHTLRNLKSRDGVISILGNHDYGVYQHSFQSDEEREADRSRLITLERDSMDWRLLLNENFIIRHGHDSLCIIGLENQACGIHQKVRRGDMQKATEGSGEGFRILLSHDPTQWDAEVLHQTDIPLTLSGHTHAMQFQILGWTPCSWFYERSAGLYTIDNQSVYVNIGLGELLPFRIGAVPEITVHTLRRK